jgi:hypothetical protein
MQVHCNNCCRAVWYFHTLVILLHSYPTGPRTAFYLGASPLKAAFLVNRSVFLSVYSYLFLQLPPVLLVSYFPSLLTIVIVNISFVVTTSYYLSAFIIFFLLSPLFTCFIQLETMILCLSYNSKNQFKWFIQNCEKQRLLVLCPSWVRHNVRVCSLSLNVWCYAGGYTRPFKVPP